MTDGPRKIERHAFVQQTFTIPQEYDERERIERKERQCGRTNCGLPYEASPHWMLAVSGDEYTRGGPVAPTATIAAQRYQTGGNDEPLPVPPPIGGKSPPAGGDSYVEDEKGCVMMFVLWVVIAVSALVIFLIGFYFGSRV